ncbi:MAG: hypothetical protein WC359_14680, partial [Dehalococcoidia bacterium]
VVDGLALGVKGQRHSGLGLWGQFFQHISFQSSDHDVAVEPLVEFVGITGPAEVPTVPVVLGVAVALGVIPVFGKLGWREDVQNIPEFQWTIYYRSSRQRNNTRTIFAQLFNGFCAKSAGVFYHMDFIKYDCIEFH